jgi:DNA ligase-1
MAKQPKTKTWPKLYKTTSKGAEQQWAIKVVTTTFKAGDMTVVSGPSIVTVHGQVGGKQQEATVHIAKGKNIGKKNETTPWQQAVSEAESKWKKQLDKGYSEQRKGASMALKPMLAHKYEDHQKKVVFPAIVQPKLDGVRAIATRKGMDVSLVSRQGKQHVGLGHIRQALLALLGEDEVLDGELYVHGMTFQELVSLVKRDQADSVKVQYHIYDTIAAVPFSQRWARLVAKKLSAVLVAGQPADGPVRFVEARKVESHDEVAEAHSYFTSLGYEGVMLRWGDEPYKAGYRSQRLLKVKAFKDEEFKIIDVVPGIGKEEDKGTFVCVTKLGVTFNARPRGSDSQRAEYLANKTVYVGRSLTVRFFEWTTGDQPVPRFPVGIAVRDYE